MPHTNETLCLCADGYIVNDNAVLLHIHPKYRCWLTPGGHIDPGENSYQAAIREIKEEVGIDVDPLPYKKYNEHDFDIPLPFAINQHYIGEGRWHCTFKYIFTSTTHEIKPSEGETVTEYKWFTKEMLENYTDSIILSESIKDSALLALEISNKK